MSRQYSIAAARAALSTIVDEVEAGAEVELTKRGKPVAVLVSPHEYERLHAGRPTFTQAYGGFLKRHATGAGVDRAFFDGLRDRSPGRAT